MKKKDANVRTHDIIIIIIINSNNELYLSREHLQQSVLPGVPEFSRLKNLTAEIIIVIQI